MGLAACLLAYSVVIAVLGPPLLHRASRSGAAPRLGIAAWVAALMSVVLAWVLAAMLIGAELLHGWGHADRLLADCFPTLPALAGGSYGGVLQVSVLLLAVLTVLSLGSLAYRVLSALRRTQRHTRAHAAAAHLAGRGAPRGPGGALILDAATRGVYCLAGRPNTIVITSSAMSALNDDQLAAVLAHEHAHLAGRHHHLLAVTAAFAKILPALTLFTGAASEVARLAEMCADDVAARRHGGDTVVGALLALTLGPAAPARPPALALSAAAVGVADRVERLLFPPDVTRARLLQGLTLGLAVVGPVLAAVVISSQLPWCIAALT